MTGADLKAKRITAGIPGRLVCARAKVDRSRLSHIERGYIYAPDAELDRIEQALDELIRAKRAVAATAAKCGWPVSAL